MGFVRAAVAVAVSMTVALAGVAHAESTDPGHCQDMQLSVSDGELGARLCTPQRTTDTVLMLMPGAAINALYWDWPVESQTYSFRRALNAAGFAVLLVDRFGTGSSSRPPSFTVTSPREAEAVAGIVAGLRRDGLAEHPPFRRVLYGGVSLSSGIGVLAAVGGAQLDGLLLTGYSHSIDLLGTLAAATTFRPAATDPDPRFAGYDLGYLTTAPGTRERSFAGPGTDPAVLIADEVHVKDTFTPAEMLTGLTSTVGPMTRQITVPVMIVNGSEDKLCSVCASPDALYTAEAPYFAPAARLRAYVLPGSGHALAIAPNTRDYQGAVIEWINSLE
ncbi:alpha/beta hydrolase [Nocardia sp. NPDC051321]|uniref:alpha/beta hydrolase n=1 Tax=Nocardia sp. NPDC051321 TaxID=3364323 RepID=UPI0037AC16E5